MARQVLGHHVTRYMIPKNAIAPLSSAMFHGVGSSIVGPYCTRCSTVEVLGHLRDMMIILHRIKISSMQSVAVCAR